MKIISTLLLLISSFYCSGQTFTNGVFLREGITTEIEKKIYEIYPTNKPIVLYFSNGLIMKANTNSEVLINSFYQEVLNTVSHPQIAKFDNSILNLTLMKGSAFFKYTTISNSTCIVSTPLIDIELQSGLFYIEASDTKIITAVLEGSLKSYNGKKELIIDNGQASIAEPNNIGILEEDVTIKPGKVNNASLEKLKNDSGLSLDTSPIFIRMNGKTIGVDK